jgi:Uma2 family endonuclease
MVLRTKEPDLERLYTPEEFENLPAFDELYELVKGKLVKKPMPGDKHGRIARRLMRKFDRFDPDENLGILWVDTTFNVGTGWMPIPDLGFVMAGNVPAESDKGVKAVPDLVVEIHSPTDLRSKTEREAADQKIKDWQTVGVKIIWAINPAKKSVEVYHAGQSDAVAVLSGQDELDGENVIPGFKLNINELFS